MEARGSHDVQVYIIVLLRNSAGNLDAIQVYCIQYCLRLDCPFEGFNINETIQNKLNYRA